MTHPLCATNINLPKRIYDFQGKPIYIKVIITNSVIHRQAAGEAIARWNDAVGSWFLMVPDKGTYILTVHERSRNEYPFVDYPSAVGLAFTNGSSGNIYVRHDTDLEHHKYINIFAHEMGHSPFMLADHPHDEINSIMSYQKSGRTLFGPSYEDVLAVAKMYDLNNLKYKASSLEGIENIDHIWHYDKYTNTGWKIWSRWIDTIDSLKPYEMYKVKAKEQGYLGNGRFNKIVLKGYSDWMYL
jgi:hypothetical protein